MSSIIFAKLDPYFLRNRKILRAGRNGRDVFLAALCFNAQRGAPGFIPAADLEPWYLARELGITEAEAADGVERVVTAGLITIDGETAVISGWDNEWGRRPKTEAERAKEYREHKRNRHVGSVTSHDQSDASRIRESRGDQREQTSRDVTGSLAQGSIRSAKDKRVSDEAQTLPASWEPSAEAISMASTLGLDVGHEAANFRDHHADKGTLIRDADALFRKWLRGSKDKGKHKPPKPGATTTKRRQHRVVIHGQSFVEDEHGELVPERNGVKQGDGKERD